MSDPTVQRLVDSFSRRLSARLEKVVATRARQKTAAVFFAMGAYGTLLESSRKLRRKYRIRFDGGR